MKSLVSDALHQIVEARDAYKEAKESYHSAKRKAQEMEQFMDNRFDNEEDNMRLVGECMARNMNGYFRAMKRGGA